MTDKIIETMAGGLYDRRIVGEEVTFPNGEHAAKTARIAVAYADAQASLQALLEAGYVVERGWQPIETVPSEPGNYLILDLGLVPCEGFMRADGTWRVCADPFRNISRPAEPTHWRAMPEAMVSTFLQGQEDQGVASRDHDPSACAAPLASEQAGQERADGN